MQAERPAQSTVILTTTATIYSDFILVFVSFIVIFVFMQAAFNANQQQNHHRRRLHRPPPSRRDIRPDRDGPAAPPPVPQAQGVVQDSRRRRCKRIADGTIDALQKGYYHEPVAHSNRLLRYDISADLRLTERHTVFYPDDAIELHRWQMTHPPQRHHNRPTKLFLLPLSTLEGARYMDSLVSTAHNSPLKPLMGVLNFASATRPGGGFLNGALAQEESIARSSSLYISLATATANQFYSSHIHDTRGGFYTHAMIYSPNVILFRTDDGDWLKPVRVEVVTSPAVNAKEARERYRNQVQAGGDGGRAGSQLEVLIRDVMRERMARVLALFELRGVKHIVLGSFGTGVFQNDVRVVAGIWRELVYGRHARFATSFDNVLFAIPDKRTMDKFKDGFGPI